MPDYFHTFISNLTWCLLPLITVASAIDLGSIDILKLSAVFLLMFFRTLLFCISICSYGWVQIISAAACLVLFYMALFLFVNCSDKMWHDIFNLWLLSATCFSVTYALLIWLASKTIALFPAIPIYGNIIQAVADLLFLVTCFFYGKWIKNTRFWHHTSPKIAYIGCVALIFIDVVNFLIVRYSVEPMNETGTVPTLQDFIESYTPLIVFAGAILIFLSLCYIWLLVRYIGKLNKQYEHLNETISGWTDILLLQHDLPDHVAFLSSLSEKDAAQYSQEIHEKLEDLAKPFWCQNGIISTVLTKKYTTAKAHNIRFHADIIVDHLPSIHISDLAISISNMLDNAIEGCSSGNVIQIRIRCKSGFLVVCVENPIHASSVVPLHLGFTTKTEPGHGFGIASIRKIAAKYDGVFLLEKQKETMKAMLSLRYQ